MSGTGHCLCKPELPGRCGRHLNVRAGYFQEVHPRLRPHSTDLTCGYDAGLSHSWRSRRSCTSAYCGNDGQTVQRALNDLTLCFHRLKSSLLHARTAGTWNSVSFRRKSMTWSIVELRYMAALLCWLKHLRPSTERKPSNNGILCQSSSKQESSARIAIGSLSSESSELTSFSNTKISENYVQQCFHIDMPCDGPEAMPCSVSGK